nr:hypothetical protein [Cressdnaviricota sp.]
MIIDPIQDPVHDAIVNDFLNRHFFVLGRKHYWKKYFLDNSFSIVNRYRRYRRYRGSHRRRFLSKHRY